MLESQIKNEYITRLSISYEILKNLFPGNLYFIAQEWLIHNSQSSKIKQKDFDLLYNQGEKEIIKGREKLSIREVHKNGLAVSELEYVLKSKFNFCVRVILIQNSEKSWISGQLLSSPSAPKFHKKSTPNILKIILNAGGGGRNGVIPISTKPIRYEVGPFVENEKNILSGLILPVVVLLCNENSHFRKLAYGLSKELQCEASVILVEGHLTDNSDDTIYIQYPDESRMVLDITSKALYKIIVNQIRDNYEKQKNIRDYMDNDNIDFIPQKLNLVDSNYSKLIVSSLLLDIEKHQQQKLLEALEYRYDESSDIFSKTVNDIFTLHIHRNIVKSLANIEIRDIIQYVDMLC